MTALVTALALGFTHTLLGPDHYLPFIVIARARQWRLGRTMALTLACGLGHVGSSVVLGLVGAAAGAALGSLEAIEGVRGGLAAWSLLLFGIGYTLFGLWRASGPRRHSHVHLHTDGTVHAHGHEHEIATGASVHAEHAHADAAQPPVAPTPWRQLTPWLLFLIFVLGPCEPLIPLFFAEAVQGDWAQALWISLGYTLATLATMHALVAVAWLGLKQLALGPIERMSHALAGAVMIVAGVGMVFFDW
jgi:hypothetical protein